MEIANLGILIGFKLAPSPPKKILDRSKVLLPDSLIAMKLSPVKKST